MVVSAVGRPDPAGGGREWSVTALSVELPRESAEFVPFVVSFQGRPVTSGLTVALVPRGERPRVWRPVDTDGGRTGLKLRGLAPGMHRVFIRTSSGAVLEPGHVVVT